MVVNRWWRGVGARVVLELAIVVGECGCFGATFEARGAGPAKFTHTVSCRFDPFFHSYEVPGGRQPIFIGKSLWYEVLVAIGVPSYYV